MNTLRELDAHLIRYEKGIADKGHGRPGPDGVMQWGGFEVDVQAHVESLAEAQGIYFQCPHCFQQNKGPVGTHYVHVTFANRNVAPELGSRDDQGQPSRWNIISGQGLDDLVLSPSIFLKSSPCMWHGYIGMNGVPPGSAC